MDKITSVITKLNLTPKSNVEQINSLIKEGYVLIAKNQYSEIIINTFLTSIGDIPEYAKNKQENFESNAFLDRKIQENSIYINEEKIIFTKEQKDIYSFCQNDEKYIFSLPTSSGKSFVIRKIAQSRNLEQKRTIIISPTISLLNEYRNEFQKMKIKSSSHSSGNSNIFILTQERALNFEFQKDDLLIVDEAYVIAIMDDRASIMVHVIKNADLAKTPIKMFLPNIRNSAEIFKIINFANQFKVYENFISLSSRDMNLKKQDRKSWFKEVDFSNKSIAIFDIKHKSWRKILTQCPIEEPVFDDNAMIVMNYLTQEFGENFEPLVWLRKGVVFSHSKIPKIFRYFSEIFFKNKKIRLIITTSTITKGVNLNIDEMGIFVNNNKGYGSIDMFEIRNALGRVGRYNQDIKQRIGKVELVGKKQVYTNFSNAIKELDKSFINASQNLIQNDEMVENLKKYDFASKQNIDWIQDKFGIPEEELSIIFKNNDKAIIEYLNCKYKNKARGKQDFKNIWEMIINSDIKEKIIALGKTHILNNYKRNFEISKPQEDWILATYMYQGFFEALKPNQTFIKSAITEFNFLINKNNDDDSLDKKKLHYFMNGNIYNGKPQRFDTQKEECFIIDKNITAKNKYKVIDALIYRKNTISIKFIDGFLSPLDSIMSNAVGIDIVMQDEIDNWMEDKGIIPELKNYILSKTSKENGEDFDYDKLVDEDSLLKLVMKVDAI